MKVSGDARNMCQDIRAGGQEDARDPGSEMFCSSLFLEQKFEIHESLPEKANG